jgi:hypothetical protein
MCRRIQVASGRAASADPSVDPSSTTTTFGKVARRRCSTSAITEASL